MKKKIEECVINGETVYLKKDSLGWHIVHPIKNKDGTINWKNLIAGGSWAKLIIVIIFCLLLVLAIWEYTHNINILMSCFEDPITLQSCKESFGFQELILN